MRKTRGEKRGSAWRGRTTWGCKAGVQVAERQPWEGIWKHLCWFCGHSYINLPVGLCLLSLLVCALAWTCQPCPAAQVMQRLIIRHGPSLSFRRQQAHYASIYCWQRGGWARAEGNEAGDRNAKWKREREERGCMAGPKKLQLRPDIRKDFAVGVKEKWKRMSVVKSQTGGEGGAVEKWLLERPHGLERRFWKRRSLKSGLMFSWKGWRHARPFQGTLTPSTVYCQKDRSL